MRPNVYDNRAQQKNKSEDSIPVSCKCGWEGTQAELVNADGTQYQKSCPTCGERFQADEP